MCSQLVSTAQGQKKKKPIYCSRRFECKKWEDSKFPLQGTNIYSFLCLSFKKLAVQYMNVMIFCSHLSSLGCWNICSRFFHGPLFWTVPTQKLHEYLMIALHSWGVKILDARSVSLEDVRGYHGQRGDIELIFPGLQHRLPLPTALPHSNSMYRQATEPPLLFQAIWTPTDSDSPPSNLLWCSRSHQLENPFCGASARPISICHR